MTKDVVSTNTKQLVCEDCAEVNPEWKLVEGYKRCSCGGNVLTIQEAGDMILDLKSRLEGYMYEDHYE